MCSKVMDFLTDDDFINYVLGVNGGRDTDAAFTQHEQDRMSNINNTPFFPLEFMSILYLKLRITMLQSIYSQTSESNYPCLLYTS